jgi:hypothetical protein
MEVSMSASGYWPLLKQGVASAVLSGGYPFAGNAWFVGVQSPIFGRRVDTIADALSIMAPRDILFIGPQAHAEGNLVIPATLTNITIIGAGNRGACFIEPSGSGDEGLTVLADDVTLMNVGVAKGSAADFALSVGDANVSPDRFRAMGCKIEGDGVACRLHGCGDVLFDDCEFAWCATAMQLRANLIGFVTQAYIRGCRFHNFTTAGIGHFAAAQVVNNLNVQDCVFERQEDGSAPTDFILLSDNLNTGYFAGNRFATPTNDAAVLTIGTGILWGPNGTEAGWSTARP